MNCYNCGNPVNETDKMCPNCGAFQSTIKQETVPAKEILKETPEEKRNANILCILSLFFLFFSEIVSLINKIVNIDNKITTTITTINELLAVVLMVTARIKYPNSVFAKVLLRVYIAFTICFIIFVIVFIISCGAALSGWDY